MTVDENGVAINGVPFSQASTAEQIRVGLAQIGADPFLKYAAIEYAVAHMFDRHPEYVRNGKGDRSERLQRADERMQRVLDARQRPPTVPIEPANVGGFARTEGPRIYSDGPTRRHSGDY